jgi:hypothetical protein
MIADLSKTIAVYEARRDAGDPHYQRGRSRLGNGRTELGMGWADIG